jgi:hypothetical protein
MYEHTLQRMIVADTLKKLRLIVPELKSEFFTKIKEADFQINCQELYNYSGYPGEKENIRLFYILQNCRNYTDFCHTLELKNGK